MRHHPVESTAWAVVRPADGLPPPLESETLALLHGFLAPIFRSAQSWEGLSAALAAKGYGIGFRHGHLVLTNEDGAPVCTGSALGVPLREIAARIGRPGIRASADGHWGALR